MALTEYMRNRLAFIESGRPLPEKKKYIIPKVSEKRKAKLESEKALRLPDEDTELQKWYAKIMQDEPGKCWETGEAINKRDTMGWHGSVAHILCKEHFPSVKTHPLNYMILKMWGGTHGQYDSSWENASKMRIWAYAVKIINILYPLLTREEKKKLPDTVIQNIHPDIYNGKKK